MLAKWSHLRLRVFLCETNNTNNPASFETHDPNMPQIEIFSKMKLEQSLKSLRIKADIFEVTFAKSYINECLNTLNGHNSVFLKITFLFWS